MPNGAMVYNGVAIEMQYIGLSLDEVIAKRQRENKSERDIPPEIWGWECTPLLSQTKQNQNGNRR